MDANAAFGDLFERLVNAHLHQDEFHRFDDREVWSHVYRKYFEKHGVVNKLQHHTIKTSGDQFTFEYSIKNEIWHCFEPISFDLSRPDIIKNKVYKWWGKLHELRENNEEFKVYLLAQMPKSNKQLVHFIESKLNVTKPHKHKNFSEVLNEVEAEKVIEEIKEHL